MEVDRPTVLRPSSLRRVISLAWYERGLSKALYPPCQYFCGLCLVLSLPTAFICFAQLWPVLASLDGPVLVDSAIRWLPHGLELSFNGTQLSLRPEGAAHRAKAEVEAEVKAEQMQGGGALDNHRHVHAHAEWMYLDVQVDPREGSYGLRLDTHNRVAQLEPRRRRLGAGYQRHQLNRREPIRCNRLCKT